MKVEKNEQRGREKDIDRVYDFEAIRIVLAVYCAGSKQVFFLSL